MSAKALFFLITFALMMGLLAYKFSFDAPEKPAIQGIRLDLNNHTPAKTLEEIISDTEQNHMEQKKTSP